MFEALGAKLLTGVVSLSMLLFSSFQGNDPSLGNLSYSKTGSYVHLRAQLQTAFENDFPSIFASGSEIPVHYNLEVKSGGNVMIKRRVVHKVSYDPTTGVYQIFKNGSRTAFTESAEQVKRELSAFEYALPYQHSWGVVTVKLEADLPKVHFAQLKKEVDLMVLWKYKKPSIKAQIDLRRDS
ncbi:MAG: hypothetical protein KBB33_04485 [Candidatus Cloacimonetes bacterium]|jgi:hypothetical protein|nr:hypothetical protein [Candidatus Cloacimonadota bacterium]HOA28992.1 hypothetical protein [Candidatus Cloacimonadota bacterium]HOH59984.1 hypothetical protein [Candidatus Cloacimonadota bacterium]HPI24916.1 hypothetical protein [Candidatus Cloacimonadota bacterium]